MLQIETVGETEIAPLNKNMCIIKKNNFAFQSPKINHDKMLSSGIWPKTYLHEFGILKLL